MRRLWVIASGAAVLAAGGVLAAALNTGSNTTTSPASPAAPAGGAPPSGAVAEASVGVLPDASPATAVSAAAVPVPGISGDGYARNVTAGATCSPAEALGFSAQARLLHCAPGAGDAQPRWREP